MSLEAEAVLDAAMSQDIAEPSGVLARRMAALRATEGRRRAVEDILGLWVKHRLVGRASQHCLQLLDAVPPGAPPPDTATFSDIERLFGDPAAVMEIRAYVGSVVPQAADLSLLCRLDRTQGAQLYVGATQFAYFVRSVYRAARAGADGGLGLSEGELRHLSRRPRSTEAWAVATRRAGQLWRLEGHDGSGGSFPQLEHFSTRVTLAAAASAGEFFDLGDDAERGGRAAKAAAAGTAAGTGAAAARPMPRAELVPIQAATLQALLVEACVLGWELSGVEDAVLSSFDLQGLLTPQSAAPQDRGEEGD